jgi:hypothetical protein
MDGNSRWQGWAALALAGLALFIALGGRQQPAYVMQAPAVQAVPAAPAAPGQFDQRGPAFEGRGPGFYAERRPVFEDRGPGFHGQRGHWGYGRPHGFGPFGFLFGIVKFVGFLLLGFLLLKLLSRRFGWRRHWGGPPWAYGPHGHPGQPGQPAEGEQDPPAPERRDDPPPTTGDTTKL